MKVLNLTLKCFQGIYVTMHTEYLHLDLSKTNNKICLITGPNGRGKTVLLSQLTPFATLGTLDERDTLPLIMSGKNGYKKITIQDGDNEYEIEHFYTPSKTSHTIKSYVKKNGEELNPNGNVTSFKEVIKVELDMEQEYMKLVRLGNNVVNMIDLKSAERKTFMSKILEDANIYLKYFKKINGEVNTLKTLISHTMNKMSKLKIEDVEDSKDLLLRIKHRLTDVENTIISETSEIGQIVFRLTQLSPTAEIDMKESKKKLEKLEKKVNSDFDSLEKLEKRISVLERELTSLQDMLSACRSNHKNNLESLDSYRSSQERIEKSIQKIEESIDEEGLKSIISSLEETIEKERMIFDEYGEIPYTKNDIEDALSVLKEIQLSLNHIYEFGSEPIKKVLKLMTEKHSVEDFIKEKIEKIEEGEDVRGGRGLVARLLKKYQPLNLPSNCNSSCSALNILWDLQSIASKSIDKEDYGKEFYTYMRMSYTTINGVLNIFKENKELFNRLPKYLKDDFILDTLFSHIGKTEMIYNQESFFDELTFITSYEEYQKHKEELEFHIEELEELRENSPLSILKKEKKEIDSNINYCMELMVAYRREEDDLVRRIVDTKSEFDELTSLLEIMEQKDSLEKMYESAEKDARERDSLTLLKRQKEINIVTLQNEKQRRTAEISLLGNSIEQYEYIKKELNLYQGYYDDWILMKDSLSTNTGIPLVFMDLYLTKALTIVNDLMDEIYNGRMYIEKFDVKSDSFNIPFIKEGHSISDIRYGSQGEKSFFSIVLSFAISYQSMSRYNIMLLDELDSVLDETNRSHYIAIIEKLEEMIKAEQIFTISHNNMFSMYPVDVISVINEEPKDQKLANYIPIEFVE